MNGRKNPRETNVQHVYDEAKVGGEENTWIQRSAQPYPGCCKIPLETEGGDRVQLAREVSRRVPQDPFLT